MIAKGQAEGFPIEEIFSAYIYAALLLCFIIIMLNAQLRKVPAKKRDAAL
jgi:hypothetical protein